MATLSPGLVRAKSVSTMASVEPMVMTMLVSGSMSRPEKCLVLAATARRKFGAPMVMGYWCGPLTATSMSLSVMALGGSKSGKPWARLMALLAMAMRVMRRITESVNCSHFLFMGFISVHSPVLFVR